MAEAWVVHDRAALLYAYGPGGIAVTAVASAFTVLMVATPATLPAMGLWLGCVSITLVVRALDALMLHRAGGLACCDGKRAISRFIGGLSLSALAWAAFPMLFFPWIGLTGRCGAAVILAAMTGGSVTVLAPSAVATGYLRRGTAAARFRHVPEHAGQGR